MHLASLPLNSSRECRLASSPSGKPSRPLKMFSKSSFTASDFRTKGTMVDSMRAFVGVGYFRRAILGQAMASSLAMLINSTVSRVPYSSVAFAPAALYLRDILVSVRKCNILACEPKRHPVISLFKHHLLVDGQMHSLNRHIKHLIHLIINSVVFQTGETIGYSLSGTRL